MRIQAILFPLLACALGGYFFYHLEIGDHGLNARVSLEQRKEAMQGELAGLKEAVSYTHLTLPTILLV